MKDKGKLLITEDDAEISQQLRRALADEYELYLAQEALSVIVISPSVVESAITVIVYTPLLVDVSTRHHEYTSCARS